MRIKTAIPITIGMVKETLGSKKNEDDDKVRIKAICTDSREIKKGDLFIGLHGESYDGSDFIPNVKKAASLTVGSKNSAADITARDTTDSLLSLASAYKKLLPIKKTIAITGSVGKSTTKDLTAMLLGCKFKVHSTEGNHNNEIGVPFTVLSAPKDTEILVIEAGMNHLDELKRISRCIEPDLSVITKIGTAHIGNFGSRERIAEAKLEILAGMKEPRAIVPHTETLLTSVLKKFETVSCADAEADFAFIKSNTEKDIFYLKYAHNTYELSISGLNDANFHTEKCLAFALAAAISVNMSPKELQDSLNGIDFSRFSKQIKIKNLTIVNDSYNSSPEAVMAALDSLKNDPSRKSALIGDMLELGNLSADMHFEVGAHAARSQLENLYIFGEYSKYVYDGAIAGGFDKSRIFINEDADAPEITANDILRHSSDEKILFKASRKMRLERIIDILKKA